MGLFMIDAQDIVVALAATDSPAYKEHFDADRLRIQSPAVLAEVATIEVSVDGGVTWVAGDAETDLGAAAAAVDLDTGLMVGLIRVHLDGAAAAERVFKVYKRCHTR